MGLGDPKSWIRDLGSGKNLFWITDPGSRVKKAPDLGSGSTTLLKGTVSEDFLLKVFFINYLPPSP
jgi:hypothetical protein